MDVGEAEEDTQCFARYTEIFDPKYCKMQFNQKERNVQSSEDSEELLESSTWPAGERIVSSAISLIIEMDSSAKAYASSKSYPANIQILTKPLSTPPQCWSITAHGGGDSDPKWPKYSCLAGTLSMGSLSGRYCRWRISSPFVPNSSMKVD